MTISASSIVRRATDLLQDQTSISWPVNEVVRWLNDAQRAILKVRPDAMNTTATMTMAVGTRQDLDLASLTPLPAKLIDVSRNVAAGSSKRAITKVERKLLDRNIPDWHALAGTVDLQHFTFDERDPKTFYVYPPALVTAQAEIMYAAYPVDIAEPVNGAIYSAVTGNISVPDIFSDDLLNLIMFRCYSKNTSYAGDPSRALAYLQLAKASLGEEIAATMTNQPK